MEHMNTADNTPLVFVSLYVMLGDADGSIEGSTVMPEAEWNMEKTAFEEHLTREGLTSVWFESEYGDADVNLENYEVKPITPEEVAVLKKFLGDFQGSFKSPTEFL